MKILVFEYITGGGMVSRPLPPSLQQEGEMMLQALLIELLLLPQLAIRILRDARLPPPPQAVRCDYVANAGQMQRKWSIALAEVDAVWPIVPEYKNLSARLAKVILQAGKRPLCSSPKALSITSSKAHCLPYLSRCGLPITPCWKQPDKVSKNTEWVLKPSDDCGASALRKGWDKQLLLRLWKQRKRHRCYLLQPWLKGQSISLSLLFRQGHGHLLSVNRQLWRQHAGTLRLYALEVNLNPPHCRRYRYLAQRIGKAIPGLWGYIGIDLLVTARGLYIVDINPRLTTSYVALNKALQHNIAACVLDVTHPLPKAGGGNPVTLVLAG